MATVYDFSKTLKRIKANNEFYVPISFGQIDREQ
jgi:hypothetical protein